MSDFTDPWAVASVPTGQQDQGGGSALAGAFDSGQAQGGGSTALFANAGLAPSLFNKTHFVGTERVGIITKAPYERQSLDFNSRQPKYWSLSRVGGERGDRAVTTDSIDKPTGKPNRPVMDTLIDLDTEYRMTEQEIQAVGGNRDVSFASQDDGKRVYAVSAKDALDSFRKAIAEFNADPANAGHTLKSEADMVGLRLRVKRTGQKPNAGGNPSWLVATKLERV